MSAQHNLPILYTFRRCPYAMRARLALYYAGIKLELREIVLRDKPAPMLEISPKGTVPVLQLADGSVIEESMDIMRFALSQNDPDGWLDYDTKQGDTLIAQNDTSFKAALDRYKYPARYPDEDCSNARENCEAFITALDARLKLHQYLCADQITLPDSAIFPFIRQCAHVDRQWFEALPTPHVQKWLSAHLAGARFKSIMDKFGPWKEGATPLLWPI